MYDKMAREQSNLIESAIELVYFMRGSITYNEMMELTPSERSIMRSFVEKRLEQEGNKLHPVY